ncbi:radical SAM enzyme [Lindgomyces ingoldianus]|uniref:Radical SAM enzyme n=1 Tax=Lindgomyces ingoldianus TaxID=673940 RepID=A0ACB6QD26_9PLEO|nr:radical SAM enzyme [Lindgomyces ingoldianus]KAF2464884.1 radical SAM enzyme [Lindgomyces ingoldianus]
MPLLRALLSNLPTLSHPLLLTTAIALISLPFLYFHFKIFPKPTRYLTLLYRRKILGHTIPISVNYHFTRVCNAACKFCFHTELTGYHAPLPTAQNALRLLAESGMRKLNFAGGEPFLYPKHLGQLCKFAKEELQLESVSIVSNGTRVSEQWLANWGAWIDILAISCDSMKAETNQLIGRAERTTGVPFDNVTQLFRIRDWCRKFGVRFKLNTVVCAKNWEEDMVDVVSELAPFRWKVFQVLVVDGENENETRRRDARSMVVTDEEFGWFCRRHKGVKGFTPEPNRLMRASYLILDEYLHFLDAGNDKRKHSDPILEVGVQKALSQVEWDEQAFNERGGVYDWSRDAGGNGKTACSGELGGVKLSDLEF